MHVDHALERSRWPKQQVERVLGTVHAPQDRGGAQRGKRKRAEVWTGPHLIGTACQHQALFAIAYYHHYLRERGHVDYLTRGHGLAADLERAFGRRHR
jgi:hypothetical protein